MAVGSTLRVEGDESDDLPLESASFFAARPTLARLDLAPFLVAYLFAFGTYAFVPELEVAAIVATPCVVLLHILTFLVSHWSVGVRCATQLSSCTPDSATLVCVTAVSGARTMCDLEQEPAAEGADPSASLPLFFIYHKSKYFVVRPKLSDGSDAMCRKLRMPSDEPFSFYFTTKGLSNTRAVSEARARYGRNDFSIPRPNFSELLKEHALAPFFVFQMLCVLLLCLDDYWCAPPYLLADHRRPCWLCFGCPHSRITCRYYSVFTLVMLVLFECTVIKSRLRNIDELRELATPASLVTVFRSNSWVQLSSEELLPGDLLSLARTPASRLYGAPIETIVPADVVMIHGSVAINESALTGESTPQLKQPLASLGVDASTRLHLGTHRASVVLGGTKLLQHTSGDQPKAMQPPGGGAVGVVVKTGFYSSQVCPSGDWALPNMLCAQAPVD